MAVVGETYDMVLEWSDTFQPWYNTFNYQVLTIIGINPLGAEDLAFAFVDDVLPSILGIVSQFVSCVGITVQSLANPADYFTDDFSPATYPGAVSGEALPEHWTVTMKCFRPFPPLRNGYKRFGGIAEAVVGGSGIASAYLTAIDNISNALGSDIARVSPDYTWRPVIVPGTYVGSGPHSPWRANRWSYTRLGTQRTRMVRS